MSDVFGDLLEMHVACDRSPPEPGEPEHPITITLWGYGVSGLYEVPMTARSYDIIPQPFGVILAEHGPFGVHETQAMERFREMALAARKRMR